MAVGREFIVKIGVPASNEISFAPANKNLQSRSLRPLENSSVEENLRT